MSRLIFCALLLFAAPASFGQVLRVDNNLAHAADFRTIQEAIDAASPGDTLYVAGSPFPYSGFTAAKPLVIVGAGYLLASNFPSNTAIWDTVVNGQVQLAPDSDGTTIMGLNLSGVEVTCSSNSVVSRNYISHLSIRGSCSILNNYIRTWIYAFPGAAEGSVLIQNNIVTGFIGVVDAPDYGIYAVNNVITGSVQIFRGVVQNNIVSGTIHRGPFVSVLYNLSASDIGNEDGNQSGVNLETVFAGGTGLETRYRLAEGSPAVGSGYEGGDLGAFGGSAPYRLSGLPPIPHIYRIVVGSSASGSTGLQVEVRARVVN
jgi:hypothetical protein